VWRGGRGGKWATQDVPVDDHVPVHGEGPSQDGPVDEHEDNEQVRTTICPC
jgi:hypothetical protein